MKRSDATLHHNETTRNNPEPEIRFRFDSISSDARCDAIRSRILATKTDTGWQWQSAHLLRTGYQSLKASEGLPRRIRRGLRTRARLESIPFTMHEPDLLAGLPSFSAENLPACQGGTIPDAEHDAMTAYLGTFGPEPGQTGHCELDRSLAFRFGLARLNRIIEQRASNSTGERRETYAAFASGVAGLIGMIGHAAQAVESAIPLAAPARRAELDRIARSCRHIMQAPPETLLDAIHLVWFIDWGVQVTDQAILTAPGRLDRTLLPYYRHDIDSGILDDNGALQLIEALYFHINAVIPNGLAIPVMVGGRDRHGRDTTNRLSYLCLEALRRTRLVYPTVGIAWHEGTPDDLTALAVDLISKGYSTPALFGDETIQRGLRRYGVPARESHRYINSTCVEITPSGSSNVWVASPYFSTCWFLLEEISHQAAGPSPAPTFDAFLDAYLDRLSSHIRDEGFKVQNDYREHRRLNGGKPLQSIFTRDCLKRGRDIDEGGARYNWIECSFVGLANLVDSLEVIRRQVFESRTMTFPGMKAVLDTDFQGHEATRLQFLNRHPKFGNADPAVDDLMKLLVHRIAQECARYRVDPDNSHFIPGAFCWIMHEQLGRQCGATPDGRRAGLPFADGGGPAQGREHQGPTSAILSSTCWDASPFIGGVAYNIKFNRQLLTNLSSVNRLKDLVVSFLRRGGFEIQVNVVDRATLQEAKAHPEAYRDLVVRIGGYTDYFTRLSPEMQDEVLLRTEFEQWSGRSSP
ncbi:MAG: hypothetical protein A2269_03045 [Lentisphaerae bacterium RIFOXYA12_FULL_60_10]|nr:MAG: hypothetical protein A2269_03045 [Lentisphaerae bacterium RIFOXYA12_FULL_60_10]